jgi:folate-binding protein YgfZ
MYSARLTLSTRDRLQMSSAQIALLADRGVVRVSGADAEKLLQGIITNDMDLLASQPALHAALLTPQGKILFEFFVVKAGDIFLLETASDKAADLARRLNLYKLRAKVAIADASDDYRVLALWGDAAHSSGETTGTVSFADPRLAGLGLRILAEAKFAADISAATNGEEATAEAYHAHRIALGVPEGGKDYPLGDAFPHEADLDQLHGVSFAKGCYVGQEVVSRMQNRASVRKRVVPIEGAAPLASGGEIKAGEATIGTVGSVAGRQALALLRLDRAAEAKVKGQALTAGDVAIALRKPGWARFALEPAEATETP